MATAWGGFAAYASNRSFDVLKKGWLLAPSLFTLFEYVRSYIFGVLWFGPETVIGPHWTFGNIAYSLSGNRLALALSSITGIYGVLFVVVVFNYFFYKLLTSDKFKTKKTPAIIVLIVLGLTLIPKLFPKLQTDGTRANFAVIQTKKQNKLEDTPKETLESFKSNLDLLHQIIEDSPESELIIYPEGSNVFTNLSLLLTPAQAKKFFNGLSETPKLIVDNSNVSVGPKTAYSRVAYLDTKNDIVGYYDKKLLTPIGEFFPYIFRVGLKLFAVDTEQIGEYVSGTRERRAVFKDIVPATLVCSDIFSPGIARKNSSKANILIVLASTSSFHGNSTIIKQDLAINRFRAAENGIPLILAANYGLSYSIDRYGNVTKIAGNDDRQILTGTALLSTEKTWYNKIGDWPVLLLSLVVLAFYFLHLTIPTIRKKNDSQN